MNGLSEASLFHVINRRSIFTHCFQTKCFLSHCSAAEIEVCVCFACHSQIWGICANHTRLPDPYTLRHSAVSELELICPLQIFSYCFCLFNCSLSQCSLSSFFGKIEYLTCKAHLSIIYLPPLLFLSPTNLDFVLTGVLFMTNVLLSFIVRFIL